jgi:hypothetical protein
LVKSIRLEGTGGWITVDGDTVQNWNLLLFVLEKLYLPLEFRGAVLVYGYLLTPYLYIELYNSVIASSLTSYYFLTSLALLAFAFFYYFTRSALLPLQIWLI